jgi:hypothetical protein
MKKKDISYPGLYRKLERHINIQNVNQEKEGFYVGSATNMARLFIFIIILFSVILTSMGFYIGARIGSLETEIALLKKEK